MCFIAPGMPHDVTGLQPTRDSMTNSAGFFRELVRRGSAADDENYYRRYDPTGLESDTCKGNGPAGLIFVTGYFGAPIEETAAEIAGQEGMDLLILDRAIEIKDGRSIRKLCMAGGEHGYRNLEYEAVQEISEAYGGGVGSDGEDRDDGEREDRDSVSFVSDTGLVIACGDGILYDEMSRDVIAGHELIIVGEDMSLSKLWKRACCDDQTWHAFMFFGSEEEKRQAFEEYHQRQKQLFRQVKAAREK